MIVPSNVEKSPGEYEEALFAKWLLNRRMKLRQPVAEDQKTSSANPSPSETGSTS